MAKVMIVDDALIMRKNLSNLLTQLGHSIVGEIADGAQAVAEYAKLQPDIVTMDLNMPGMSGIKAIETIIERFPDARILVISALGQKHVVFNAIEKGAKNYLVKPITSDKLAAVLSDMIKA